MKYLRRTRWEDGAACADVEDPEIFFEIENAVDQHRVADPLKIAEALGHCATCPIEERCFYEAVRSRSYGIRGGTTSEERSMPYRLSRKYAKGDVVD